MKKIKKQKKPLKSRYKLFFIADKQYLNSARRYLRECLQENGFHRQVITDLELALVEWLENIIKYAYKGGRGEVVIEAFLDEKKVDVSITDSGVAFNPLEYTPPDTHARMMKGIGGRLGIQAIKKLCDKVRYKRQGHKNVITFSKKLNKKT